MMPTQHNLISRFPMGPQIRTWFEIPDTAYEGHENPSPTADELAQFTDAFLMKLEDSSPKDQNHLVDLLEELVGMNLPLLAVKLVDAYPQLFPDSDFRAQLHLGNAAMLVSDLSRAESAFIEAQRLIPEEPAPYVNLTQIYCYDGLLDKAREWCDAGLNAEPNNPRLWELLAWLEQQDEKARGGNITSVANEISKLAQTKNSWAGMSLACDLKDPEDVGTKVSILETFWDEGCRDTDYLIEFTAVLGMAGRYDRIPMIFWQVEKQSSQGLPWQLSVHLAQAFLGLGREADAKAVLLKLNDMIELPENARQITSALLNEIQDSSTPS